MNHFRHERGEEPFLTTLLPTTVRAMPKYEDKISSFLAAYEALACRSLELAKGRLHLRCYWPSLTSSGPSVSGVTPMDPV